MSATGSPSRWRAPSTSWISPPAYWPLPYLALEGDESALNDLAEGRTVHGVAALVAFAPALSTLPRSMRSSSTASYDRAYPPARQ